MFDIGFSEIVVIAIVSLIVIGPERLPKVARTMGHLFGRMQRYVNDVKADISREIELDELRKLQASMQDAALSAERSLNAQLASAHSDLSAVAAPSASPSESFAVPPVTDAASPPEPDPQLELRLDSSPRARV